MNKKIGIFDSGCGGLTILEELKKVLPNGNFIYYADTKNNPYGEKKDQELLLITEQVVSYLKNKGCKLIVIACNTATTKCMKKLRKIYPELIFVGTVPAIKVASDHHYKNTLVMATPATIESERTLELIRDHAAQDQKIYLLACPGLALAIESHEQRKIENLLHEFLNPYKDKKIDSIVLGCTHYPLIKEEILKEMPNTVLLDGSKGVAQEVKRQLEKNNLLDENFSGNIEMIDSINI